MSGVAAAIIMAGATGAAAQTAGAGSQVAAAAPGGTVVSTGARANFIIARAIGLGRLDISSLTGGMVRDGDAPRVSTTSDGDATATESNDAGGITEAESTAVIEATVEAIQRTTTTETQTIDITVAAIEPDPVSAPSDGSPTAGNNGVGGGRENNRGVGGGKTGNRGGKK